LGAKTGGKGIGTRSQASGRNFRIDLELARDGPQGSLDLFADGFTLHLELAKGRPSGSAVITGNSFSAKLHWKGKKTWKLEYLQEGPEAVMGVYARLGKVTGGTNLFGIRRKSPTTDLRLSFSRRLGLHGRVVAKRKDLAFGLRFARGGATSVEVQHRGKRHRLEARFYRDGTYAITARVKVASGEVILSKGRRDLEVRVSFSF